MADEKLISQLSPELVDELKSQITESKTALTSGDHENVKTSLTALQEKLNAVTSEFYAQAAAAQKEAQDLADEMVENESTPEEEIVDSTLEEDEVKDA